MWHCAVEVKVAEGLGFNAAPFHLLIVWVYHVQMPCCELWDCLTFPKERSSQNGRKGSEKT